MFFPAPSTPAPRARRGDAALTYRRYADAKAAVIRAERVLFAPLSSAKARGAARKRVERLYGARATRLAKWLESL